MEENEIIENEDIENENIAIDEPLENENQESQDADDVLADEQPVADVEDSNHDEAPEDVKDPDGDHISEADGEPPEEVTDVGPTEDNPENPEQETPEEGAAEDEIQAAQEDANPLDDEEGITEEQEGEEAVEPSEDAPAEEDEEKPTEDVVDGGLEPVEEGGEATVDDQTESPAANHIEALIEEDNEAGEDLQASSPTIAEGEVVNWDLHEEDEKYPDEEERYPDDEENYHDDEEEYEEEAEEQEEEEEIVFNREALLENYRNAQQEKKQLLDQNNALQTKLAECFRKKKAEGDAGVVKIDSEKSSDEQRQRYDKYMSTLNDLRRQRQELQDDYQNEIETLKEMCLEKQKKVDSECQNLLNYKRDVALKSVNSRTGRGIDIREVDELLEAEHKKESEVVAVRLESIKLQNQLKKEEYALKSREELAEGLHLIDFEQLKIENQTYNEKIEERNEELLKLRKKIESTVQILTHVKEKLQFVELENRTHQSKQIEVDVCLKTKRDQLAKIKQRRDTLRRDTQKLRQNCGLLGNEALLRNFEECVDIVEEKKNKLEHMRMEHAELNLTNKGFAKKIAVARSDKETLRQLP